MNVPSNFGKPGKQVYLVLSNFLTVIFFSFGSTCNFRGVPSFISDQAAPGPTLEASGFKGSGNETMGATMVMANDCKKGGRRKGLEHFARCGPAVLITRLLQTLTEDSFIHSVLLLMLL